MKRLFLLSLLFALLNFTGCKNYGYETQEIKDITFVRIVGIDKVLQNDAVRLTITSKQSEIPSDTQLKQQYYTVNTEGETVFDAVRKLSSYSDKKPYWGHVDFLIVGEEAAKDGIVKYLDFFLRYHQFRSNMKILIAVSNTAEKIIESASTSNDFISDRLSALFKGIKSTSVAADIPLHKVIWMFGKRQSSAYIPCIKLTDVILKDEEEQGKSDIILEGFAVFKGDKLFDYIFSDRAKALNFMTGNFQSGIIVVKDKKGGKVSLEIIETKTSLIPQLQPFGMSVAVDISLKSNIGEHQSGADIINKNDLDMLAKQQDEIIISQVEKIIKYAQENNIDVFEIWNAFFHRYPLKWPELSENWGEKFPLIVFSVRVKSQIHRTYIMENTIMFEEH